VLFKAPIAKGSQDFLPKLSLDFSRTVSTDSSLEGHESSVLNLMLDVESSRGQGKYDEYTGEEGALIGRCMAENGSAKAFSLQK